MPFCARVIAEKSRGAVDFIWAFIDGTIRETCRPTYFQERVYSGHKRCHGLKFQSIVIPDGFIALLYGPVAGSRHDGYMLDDSGMEDKLLEMFPPDCPNIYRIYGDPAYKMSRVIFTGFRTTVEGSIEAQWNSQMSAVRTAVEWMFNEIARQWRYLDFTSDQKIYREPVALYYFIGAFLTNIRSTMYGNTTSEFFQCRLVDKLKLHEYIDLVSIESMRARLDEPDTSSEENSSD
jgi:hypothetical protein